MDANRDGVVVMEEYAAFFCGPDAKADNAAKPAKTDKPTLFETMDTNDDGFVTVPECAVKLRPTEQPEYITTLGNRVEPDPILTWSPMTQPSEIDELSPITDNSPTVQYSPIYTLAPITALGCMTAVLDMPNLRLLGLK
jgi:hypothetical protein